MSRVVFREVQKFRQPWVWVLVLGVLGPLVVLFGSGLVQQLGSGRPWGNRPMSDGGLIIASLITFAIAVAVVWLMLALTLVVEVRDDALHVHFNPLKRRTVAYSDIVHVEAVRYRPIVEYGGWGLRRGRNGWAYNVSGNQGVRLDLRDGSDLLLGSQRFVELAAAIDKARGR
jgi:hypothetical protein